MVHRPRFMYQPLKVIKSYIWHESHFHIYQDLLHKLVMLCFANCKNKADIFSCDIWEGNG